MLPQLDSLTVAIVAYATKKQAATETKSRVAERDQGATIGARPFFSA